MPPAATVRDATTADIAALARIYNHYVAHSVATFDEAAIAEADMAARVSEVRALQLPWLVTESQGRVLGFAYGGRWKQRSAYRHTIEVTVYLDPAALGQGHGTALYEALFARLPACGCHAVIGVISLPNPASVALHERFGLRQVAHFSEVGYKFGRWVDVGYWQRTLPRQS